MWNLVFYRTASHLEWMFLFQNSVVTRNEGMQRERDENECKLQYMVVARNTEF